MNRHALFSTTADHYCAAAPLSALAWAHFGWTPVAMLIGEGWDRPLPSLVRCELERIGQTVRVGSFEVPSWSHVPRFHMATACRRPAIPLIFAPDDYVVLGDADMILLDGKYLAPSSKPFNQYFANVYDGVYPAGVVRYPSCYQAATARTWGEILSPRGSSIAEVTVDHMERSRGYENRYGTNWDCEQGFHNFLDPWIAAHPDGIALHHKRNRLQKDDYPAFPVDCHIRQNMADEKLWGNLIDAAPLALVKPFERWRERVMEASK